MAGSKRTAAVGQAAVNDDLAERLHAVAIRLLRHVRVSDAKTGLTAPRLSVLSVLVFGGPRTVTQLAEAEQVAPPTMTRLLQGLEADGHVRRQRSTDDARQVVVSATAAGRRLLEIGRSARLKRLERVLAQAAPDERAAIAHATDVLARALHEVESIG